MSFWKNLFGAKPPQSPASGLAQAPSRNPAGRPAAKPKIVDSVVSGNVPELRARLKQGGDPNETVNNGVSVLAYACMRGDAECAKALIEFGANPDVADGNGWTPLMHAVFQGKKLPCVQVLLDAGADLSPRLKSGVGIENLANNSTPEIAQAIRAALDRMSRAAFDGQTRLAGQVVLLISFEPTRLHIGLGVEGGQGFFFDVSGTRMNGLLDKAVRVEYEQGNTVVTEEAASALRSCCIEVERRFSELINAGTWEFHDPKFRTARLLPIVVTALEPWKKAHLTSKRFSVAFSD